MQGKDLVKVLVLLCKLTNLRGASFQLRYKNRGEKAYKWNIYKLLKEYICGYWHVELNGINFWKSNTAKETVSLN